jgi:precorrin-2 dehydrogenase/sirohydrochlorin ferrochelatase
MRNTYQAAEVGKGDAIVQYYPIALRIKGRRVLVAGGGEVAERKIKTLLSSGAKIYAVSPTLTAPLKKMAQSSKITWFNRKVKFSDLHGVGVVIAATSEAHTNSKISRWARKQGILANVVDQPRLSSFISPAILRQGKTLIAVYTDGRNPVLARDLKNYLKGHWHEFLSYRNRL